MQDRIDSRLPIVSNTTESSPPWINPRKRPRNSDFTSLFEPLPDDDSLRVEDNSITLHATKRSRAAQWPLKDADGIDESDADVQNDEGSGHHEKRASAASIRPSRFQEGSMNDKISQRPPSPYTKDEGTMEDYTRSQGLSHDGRSMIYDAGIERAKPSGMFRFGKAIANTLNPASIWQGINVIWNQKDKDKESKAAVEKSILQERQNRAIEAYAELKKNGYKRTQSRAEIFRSHEIPAIKCEDTENVPRDPFRDSGIEVDGDIMVPIQDSSMQEANHNEALEVPPSMPLTGRYASPIPDSNSKRKSSFQFRKPSLQNLKKVKSQIHLPSVKKPGETPFSPLTEANTLLSPRLTGSGLRRQSSKRDISRHTKLSKKVSDLENKLQIARLELETAMSNAPPVPNLPTYLGRKAFVPGGLSSLPSEGNMSPQKIADHGLPALGETQNTGNHGRTVGRVTKKESKPAVSTTRLTRSIVVEEDAPEANVEPDKFPKSLNKKASASILETQRPEYVRSYSGQSSAGVETRQLPRLPSKTPDNSPTIADSSIPPVPAPPPSFDPLMVDQAKLMGLRSITSKVLFGGLAEDLANLRKEFPTATEADLLEYLKSLGWQPRENKTTDFLTIAHVNRPQSPCLGRPLTSPMRTRSKSSKHGTSPPPPSLSSAKKARFEPYARETPTRSDSFKSRPLMKTYGRSTEATKYYKDKPLPETQKEAFNWDEDVF